LDVRGVQETARRSLEDEVIEWAEMPVSTKFLDRDERSRAAELELHLFLAFHLSQVQEPTSDDDCEEDGTARRKPSTAEIEAAAFAQALSVSFRELATALKHGLMGPDDAVEAMRRVRTGARLFDFPWDASHKARRDMVMDLVEHQLAGIGGELRAMQPPRRVPHLSAAALGVLSGICVRMPDLAGAAQQPEVLRAVAAVVRARAGVRDGGPGIDAALQRLFATLGMPLHKNSVRQARMDWKRERRDGKPRRRKKSEG
jgi:hypothetical protein